MTDQKPSVLFVCVHNAGRSQMAAGWLRELAGDRVEVRSAGSMPANQINPVAVEAMREVGIDITAEQPKVLTTEALVVGRQGAATQGDRLSWDSGASWYEVRQADTWYSVLPHTEAKVARLDEGDS